MSFSLLFGFDGLLTVRSFVLGHSSRRPFTPKDHWLMTSQFDLNSFIQSVV